MDTQFLESPANLSLESEKKLTALLANSASQCREDFKAKHNNLGILLHFKRCFHVTPISLKNNTAPDELRTVAIYLLSNYSRDPLGITAEAFHIDIETILQLKNDVTIPIRYAKEIDRFFEEIERNYKLSIIQHTYFMDKFLTLDQDILDKLVSEMSAKWNT